MSIAATAHTFPKREQAGAPSIFAQTVRLVAWVTGWIAREIRVRRSMRQLAEFDDHMLRDLGIVRADIEGAVRRGHDAPCNATENFGRINPAPNLLPPLQERQR
jgi:uncharacterized protein YjiS (DUF1127 family)